eukprot:1953356-Prymnesium_polylepis.2
MMLRSGGAAGYLSGSTIISRMPLGVWYEPFSGPLMVAEMLHGGGASLACSSPVLLTEMAGAPAHSIFDRPSGSRACSRRTSHST